MILIHGEAMDFKIFSRTSPLGVYDKARISVHIKGHNFLITEITHIEHVVFYDDLVNVAESIIFVFLQNQE